MTSIRASEWRCGATSGAPRRRVLASFSGVRTDSIDRRKRPIRGREDFPIMNSSRFLHDQVSCACRVTWAASWEARRDPLEGYLTHVPVSYTHLTLPTSDLV